MTGRAVIFESPGKVVTGVRPERALSADDVLIAVDACGVCGSDLASFAHGHYIEPGQIMGHEIAGRVIDAGANLADVIGSRVTVRPMQSCGECSYCLDGNTHLCGKTYGPSLGYGTPGGFADELVLANAVVGENLFPVPDEVDPFDLLWAEPFAVALHAVDLLGPGVTRVLITGAGAVGLTVVAAAIAQSMTVTVIEPLESRRDAAVSIGASAVAPGALDPAERFDALVDASGVPAAIRAALPAIASGGPVVMVGLNDDPIAFPVGDHPIQGSFAYLQKDIVRSVELISSGAVRLSSLVTHRMGIEEAGVALAGPAAGQSMVKVAIVPEERNS